LIGCRCRTDPSHLILTEIPTLRLSRLLAVAVAAAAFAAVAPSAHAAEDLFIKVDGVAGTEAPGGNLTGFIRVNEFSWGAENKRTIGGATGGTATNTPALRELEIQKTVDENSPALLERLVLGTPLKSVDLIARTASNPGAPVNAPHFRYSLQGAFITDIQHSGSSDGMTETIKFVYGAGGTLAQAQDSTGKVIGVPRWAGWNLITNRLMAPVFQVQ
jgi:type VI protein secretion system component Hcp